MTTNLSVDLRELFIMPNVLERAPTGEALAEDVDAAELMPLSQARKVLAHAFGRVDQAEAKEQGGVPALEQVRRQPRNVLVGAPGSGKSTFLEWLQLKVASAEEVFALAQQQAIPLLIRVRQLDPDNLPESSALIEKATGSRDFAALMPSGWIHRQMSRGAVVLMLDGLDEVEPFVRDRRIVPWFTNICEQYPNCSFIVSSRPVGYPAGLLTRLLFCESQLLDFTEDQVLQYARHWCVAIRLARNETVAEARREGASESVWSTTLRAATFRRIGRCFTDCASRVCCTTGTSDVVSCPNSLLRKSSAPVGRLLCACRRMTVPSTN
jgi:energy-coupling factor transporter ATP-binding protein EcfA2